MTHGFEVDYVTTPDAEAKAALFRGESPEKRVEVLMQAGRIKVDDVPYVLAHMRALLNETVGVMSDVANVVRKQRNELGGPLTWTTEAPTEPGWYWARFRIKDAGLSEPEALYVQRHNGELMTCVDDDGGLKLRFHELWAGPIAPPPDA